MLTCSWQQPKHMMHSIPLSLAPAPARYIKLSSTTSRILTSTTNLSPLLILIRTLANTRSSNLAWLLPLVLVFRLLSGTNWMTPPGVPGLNFQTVPNGSSLASRQVQPELPPLLARHPLLTLPGPHHVRPIFTRFLPPTSLLTSPT